MGSTVAHVEVSAVIEIEQAEILGDGPTEQKPSHLVRWLAGALAIAVVVAAALGGWVYLDHRRSTGEREAVGAAVAWVDAMNAHDLKALQGSMTVDGAVVFFGSEGVIDGPLHGDASWAGAQSMFDDGIHLAVLGEPTVSNGAQVSLLIHMTRGNDDQTDFSVFDLQRVGGALKVATARVLEY